jgi:hypothetical protein
MQNNPDNLIHMLVRSNPAKNNSFEYGERGLRNLRALQERLGQPRQQAQGFVPAEHTELYTIDVERGLCSLVTVSKTPTGPLPAGDNTNADWFR